MFTLSLLYVVFYLFIFLSFLVLTFSQLPVYVLTHFSTSSFMIFLQKYKPSKNLYLWLIFALTGLPPVGLFFVKFNIFFFVLYQAHIFIIIILFLLFFLNMLFYTQLFNFRNFKKDIYSILNPEVFSKWSFSQSSKTYLATYNTYWTTLLVVNTLMFLVLTVVFFSDYFLILNII